MGGKDALERILTLDADAAVIVVSGYSTDPVLADYGSYGFRGRLEKPFLVQDLARVLHAVVADAHSPSHQTCASKP